MPSSLRKVLVLGDATTAEMRPLSRLIAETVAPHELRESATVDVALGFPEDDWFPDLLIVLQNRPDEFSARDIESLLRVFPLARLSCCYGFWCESDGRTRHLWPPASRIAVRIAASRIRREIDVLENRSPALPKTAGRDEVFAFDCPGIIPAPMVPRRVGIVSPDRALREWVHDLLDAAGFEPRSGETESAAAAVVVWDADPLDEMMYERLRRFKTSSSGVTIVALMNAAVEDDRTRLIELGIDTVVSKLAPHELLLEALAERSTVG